MHSSPKAADFIASVDGVDVSPFDPLGIDACWKAADAAVRLGLHCTLYAYRRPEVLRILQSACDEVNAGSSIKVRVDRGVYE